MVGSQFHPEFRSRPLRPHPLFRDFVGAAAEYAASLDRARTEAVDAAGAIAGGAS
jgi:CTP synthase